METHNTSTVKASKKNAESLSIVIVIEIKGMTDLKTSITIFSWPEKISSREAITPDTDAAIHIILEIRLHNLCCFIKTTDAKAAAKKRKIDTPNKVLAVNIPILKS
jgi:hypothetical protein